LRRSSEIRIEQNLGPHMLQNWAVLNASCGKVSSCIPAGGLRVERETETALPS